MRQCLCSFLFIITRLEILIQVAGDHAVVEFTDLIGASAVEAFEGGM